MAEPSEHVLQTRVLNHLVVTGKPGVFGIAIPNAARRSLRMGARMKAEGLTPGVADLLILLPAGRVGWLELKTVKGRQSDSQKGFEAKCTRLGHAYALARSLDEAILYLRSWGALR